MTPAMKSPRIEHMRHLGAAALMRACVVFICVAVQEAMSDLVKMDMEDVRQVVKSLIGQGLDSKKPERAPHHEVVIAYEACSELCVPVHDAKHVFKIVTNLLEQQMGDCNNLLKVSTQSCKTVAKFADRVEAAYASPHQPKEANQQQNLLQEKANEFERVAYSGEDPEMLDQFFDFEIDAATLALYDELVRAHVCSRVSADGFFAFRQSY